ncbi:STAS/SEC14 domain-containing protein [Methanosarcina sp. T3]|uniref:STAS/SEC14 domain-containing protein n=1 Tax=Methanosarcina sp. T3 TaxID=3439062 RepID=UPI003F86DD42
MLEIIQDLPGNIVAVSASGMVTKEDYEKVFIPAIDDKIQKYGKIRILYLLGKEFKDFTSEAMLEDAAVGLRHITAFEKIAVVSDVDWIINAVKMFKFAIPCPVGIFKNEEFSEAKTWISE